MVILKIAMIAHLWGLFEITKHFPYKLRENFLHVVDAQ